MIDPAAKRDIDWVFERHFDTIAEDLDTITRKHNLLSSDVIEYVRNWEFDEYYEEWVEESGE